ncbi:hypothetical protein [Jiangella alkaliphila]|uniref:Uncharacterized protein n=1 Tax=Jiangella alkaliphila TaxID=419479 RepID=A0A1H2LUB9_9ACTN|nr:hypothetical protein [Jiangella alkaliphila]SDU84181.1 hypothetical protein SAMN04488563_6623 [Jiangella alkaliphila]
MDVVRPAGVPGGGDARRSRWEERWLGQPADEALFADAGLAGLAGLAAVAAEAGPAGLLAELADAGAAGELAELALLAEAPVDADEGAGAEESDGASVIPAAGGCAPLSLGAATAVPAPMPSAAIVPTASHVFFWSFIVSSCNRDAGRSPASCPDITKTRGR